MSTEQKTFKDYVNEGINYEGALYDALELDDSKLDQIMWDWFEKNLGDSGIYAGDAVPEDYIEIMSPKEQQKLYKHLANKSKNFPV